MMPDSVYGVACSRGNQLRAKRQREAPTGAVLTPNIMSANHGFRH